MTSIEPLTPEQEIEASAYIDVFLKLAKRTLKEWDQAAAEAAVYWIYKNVLKAKAPPKIFTFDSPEDCIKAFNKNKPEDVKSAMWFCNWWPGWICFYQFKLNVLDKGKQVDQDHKKFFETFVEHWKHLHIMIPNKGTCALVRYPEYLSVTEVGNNKLALHSGTGPALKYRGATKAAFQLHGSDVPEWLIMKKREDWSEEEKKEASRIMLRLMGSSNGSSVP